MESKYDRYEISDSDYKTLSDILITKGLSGVAFDIGLVQLIYLMVKYNKRFPISITYLKEMWGYENIPYNFVSMVGDLLKNKVVSIRKLKKDTYIKDNSITKSNSEDLDKELFVVVYGTKDFNEIFKVFSSILNKFMRVLS